jgi:glutathione S-transferase
MMRLHYSPASPYVRKVLVMAHETDLIDQISLEPTSVWEDDGRYRKVNPLCRIPALVCADGSVLVDSLVICCHLDGLHDKAKLLPGKPGALPVEELHLHAVANGAIDAALTLRLDQRRGLDRPDDPLMRRQYQAIDAALDYFEADMGKVMGRLGLAPITLGVALGYLDFRFPALDWRSSRPNLTAWNTAFSARPSMRATLPHD